MTKSPTITIAEVAQAYSVSTRTVRRRIADGSLPAYRIGPKLIRLDPNDVERLFRPIPTRATA